MREATLLEDLTEVVADGDDAASTCQRVSLWCLSSCAHVHHRCARARERASP